MFSATTQHAIRALASLADLPEGASILGRDLARVSEIPPSYLAKILLVLRNARIIATARGSGGGYWLRRVPGEITLSEVVTLFEGDAAMTACLLGAGRECGEDSPCSAHHAWSSVRKSYLDFLEATTLADIAASDGPHAPFSMRRGRAQEGARKGDRP